MPVAILLLHQSSVGVTHFEKLYSKSYEFDSRNYLELLENKNKKNKKQKKILKKVVNQIIFFLNNGFRIVYIENQTIKPN